MDLIRLVHEEACNILFYIGVKCNNEKIREIFESSQMAFFDETTNRIHLSDSLIKYCLETTQKRHNHPVPNRSFGGGGTAAFWIQGDDWILPTNEIHMAEIFRLAEEFSIPFMFKGCGKVNRDDLEIMRKYYSGYIYTEVKNEQMINDLIYDNNLCTAHSIITSPLCFNNDVDNFLSCLENKLPVYLTTMPISCFTGPATMYSLASLAWAEFLAGLCLAQLKRPRAMVVNGAFPAAGDPLNGYLPALGTIFHNMCNHLIAKISEFYALPSIQSGCTVSKKLHFPSNEYITDHEAYRGFSLWNTLNDWHQLRHCFGFVNYLTDFDINKMRRDCVALQYVLDNDIKFEEEVEEAFYDPETFAAVSNGVEYGFKEIMHTTKNVGILSEYLNGEE